MNITKNLAIIAIAVLTVLTTVRTNAALSVYTNVASYTEVEWTFLELTNELMEAGLSEDEAIMVSIEIVGNLTEPYYLSKIGVPPEPKFSPKKKIGVPPEPKFSPKKKIGVPPEPKFSPKKK